MKAGDFQYISGSVGVTTTGSNVAPSIVSRIKENKWKNLRMLDICCGVGTLGLWALVELGSGVVKNLVLADIEPINIDSTKLTIDKYKLTNVVSTCGNCFENVPKDPYDLIVSHPPCCYGIHGNRRNVDINWEFHKDFFIALPEYLKIGGEAWLIEHNMEGRSTVVKLFKEVADLTKIDFYAWEHEPRDPNFSWMRLRRIA